MIKQSTKYIFFTFLFFSQLIRADVWGWFNDPANRETFKSAKLIAEQEIEHLLQPHEQKNIRIKNSLLTKKEQKSKLIKKNLKNQLLSKKQAKDQAKILAQDYCVNFIAKEAVTDAKEVLKKNGYKNNDRISIEIAQIVYSTIKTQAFIVINKGGRLTNSLQNLHETVKRMVEQEIETRKVHEMYSRTKRETPAPFQQKKFTEQDIREVLPKTKVAEMRQKIERTQGNPDKPEIWREKDCSICYEEFSDMGVRVNLPCGHGSLCLKCLVTIMQDTEAKNKNNMKHEECKCPLCRKPFDSNDYSADHLKQYADSYQMAFIKKTDPQAYNKIVSFFSTKK